MKTNLPPEPEATEECQPVPSCTDPLPVRTETVDSHGIRYDAESRVIPESMPPGTVFKFLTFPEDYETPPYISEFLMGPKGRASYKDRGGHSPFYIWPVAGCTVKVISTPGSAPAASTPTAPSKKGPSMFSLLKLVPKAAPWLLVGYLSVANYSSDVYDWWTGPTQLELGDWVQVTTCDACQHAVPAASPLCPDCGGEAFTARKGQALMRPASFRDGPIPILMRPLPVGHAFPDGTTSLPPGNWTVPERTVKTEEAR